MDGGVIHAAILQSTLRERACSIPEVKAAAALTAMFVPAATAGFADATRIAGKRRLPRTSPTAPPSNAAADRTRQVKPGGGLTARRKNEALQRLEALVDEVAELL